MFLDIILKLEILIKIKFLTSWVRKQTLTSAERYVTEEFKIYEEKILGAEEKILKLEQQIFLKFVH
jgi:DNA mismatch repair protein MutS